MPRRVNPRALPTLKVFYFGIRVEEERSRLRYQFHVNLFLLYAQAHILESAFLNTGIKKCVNLVNQIGGLKNSHWKLK